MPEEKRLRVKVKSSERGEEATVTVVETKQTFVLSSRDTERLPTGIETFIHVLFWQGPSHLIHRLRVVH